MSEHTHLIDITLPFSERLSVWPGDVPVRIRQERTVSMVSELTFSSHVGTHLDAPLHFVENGATVDQLRLDVLIGPAWLADMGDCSLITAELLELARIPQGVERLLLKTQNSARVAHLMATVQGQVPFDETFISLDRGAGQWLVDRGIRLVGIDGPSVDPYGTPDFPVHHLVLPAGIVIVENLRLQDVEPGAYRLICLPMYYLGGDGAPVRAVLETNR
jgi:arylformamidase